MGYYQFMAVKRCFWICYTDLHIDENVLVWIILSGLLIFLIIMTYKRGQKLRQDLERERQRCNDLEQLVFHKQEIDDAAAKEEEHTMEPAERHDNPPGTLIINSPDKVIMDKVNDIMSRNLDNPDFNITMFAHEMAMSRTNLFAKIKSITGQTPNELLMTLRLEKGAYLLRNNPELSISEIADRTGFTSANYFSRCFNELYHVRPLNYRKGGGKDSI